MSFLQYTGIYEKTKGIYKFTMQGEKQKYFLESYSFSAIADPTIDNTFKQIFLDNKSITKALLNAFLFPKKNSIKEIEFLPNEHPGIGPYSRGSIRMDVVCKCTLDSNEERMEIEESNDEEDFPLYANGTELFIDLEIQIGYNANNIEKKFLKYVRILDKKYALNKVMVLALIYNPGILNSKKNKSSMISFTEEYYEKNFKTVTKYDDCVVYQIDLNYCYKLILKEKPIFIFKNENLLEKGEEWIKFLTLSSWCLSDDDFYYIFPPLNDIIFADDQIFEAFKILIDQGIGYEKGCVDRKYLIEEIDEFNLLKKQNNKLLKKVEKFEELYGPIEEEEIEEEDKKNKNKKIYNKKKKTYPPSKNNKKRGKSKKNK